MTDLWHTKRTGDVHGETSMLIRKADGGEMLKLWGYPDADHASPTARFFYHHISSGNTVFWALDHDGELIGELYVFLDIEEDRDFADGVTTAYLCAFRVRKEYRGQGLGTAMINTALLDLKFKGFRRATIGVNDERNENLYRALGFTAKIKDCYIDPCAMDENMCPVRDEEGYSLLAKEL